MTSDSAGVVSTLPKLSHGHFLALHQPVASGSSAAILDAFAKRQFELAGYEHLLLGTPTGSSNGIKAFEGDTTALLESLGVSPTATAHRVVVLDGKGAKAFELTISGPEVAFDEFLGEVKSRGYAAAPKDYNLADDSLALQGYDPVSYFKASPTKGKAEWSSVWKGARYLFATEENRRSFAQDPEAYAPEYGGWCATAMADGEKVEIDPKNYKVTNGRLFLFYTGIWGNAIKSWNKDEAAQTIKADGHWKNLTGETPED